MYYERLMSLAGLEKRAYPQNGYGVNGQQNPPGAPVVQDYSLTDALYPGRRRVMQAAAQNTQNSNLTGQSPTGTATKPWNHNTWNERQAGRAAYNVVNSAAGAVKSFGNGVANAWDKTKYHVGDTLDRAYKGFAELWNPLARSIEDTMTGAYHGITDVFGDPNADRFAQNSRMMQQGQQRPAEAQQQVADPLARYQQQQKERSDKFNAEWEAQMQAAKDGLAQSQARSADQQKFHADLAAWRQADPESYGRYVDEKYKAGHFGHKPGTPEWEASQKFSRDALARWQASRNPSQQTQQQAGTQTTQPSAAMQQIQNNISSTQNPSFQTKVTPVAGAPAVQQPVSQPYYTPQSSPAQYGQY